MCVFNQENGKYLSTNLVFRPYLPVYNRGQAKSMTKNPALSAHTVF